MSTASELLIEQSELGEPSLLSDAACIQSLERCESNAPSGGWNDAVADTEFSEFIANKRWMGIAEMA